eukprot:Skav205824  [mRNA]  locus=scaffold870:37881:38372:+ [translate_table: standard]
MLRYQEWLEWQMQQPDWVVQLGAESRLMTVLLVLKSINKAFHILYKSGAWLPAETAREVGQLGLRALRGIAKLADVSLQLGQPRFALYPKFHMLLHQFYWLVERADQSEWQESPLNDCCQIDESFIGSVSRMSRRVAPMATVNRTVDVYLASIWKLWMDSDAA